MNLHNFTVCDQVRQEITGKFLMIGVYGNVILANAFPASFPLAAWMLMEAETLGEVPFTFRIRLEATDEELFQAQGTVEVADLQNWTPMGFGAGINMERPGTLLFDIQLGDEEDWRLLRKTPVVLMD